MKAIQHVLWGPRKSLKRLVMVLGIAALYLMPFLTIPAWAPIYMKYGEIGGEATSRGHERWIEIESTQFGVGRQIESLPGQPRTVGPPVPSEFTLTKRVDKSSPLLFLEAVRGNAGQLVTIDFTKVVDGVTEEVVYQLTLSDVLASGFSQSSGGADIFENIALKYERIGLKYIPYDAAGKAGEPVTAEYDFSAPAGQ